jgi:hypothetical protein
MRVAGGSNRPLLAPRTGGVCRGDQPEKLHEFSRGSETAESANFSHPGNRHGAWHAPQSRQGFNHRGQAPRCHVLLPCLLETLESCGGLIDGPAICVKDDGLRRGRADHCREPPERGRAPMGPARGADSVSEQEGFAPELGVLESTEGLCSCSGEIPAGGICHCGDSDRGASPRAGPAGQGHGGAAVGFDAVPGFFWHA